MTLQSFFEKFDLFADAPNAVAKMREVIRHLAVTGTLVDQNQKDGSALGLLKQISPYKTALVEQGKLRGPTTVAPMSPEEGTHVLPSSWTWVRFGEIMVNRDGDRIPVSREIRANKAKTYDYYGASGVIDKIDGFLFDKPLLLIGEDGANLINRSTPIAFMARGKYWVNNHAHVLDGISEDFLRYIELHINAINLEPYVTGTAQPKMNQAKMNSIPIALPPLAEQKRIVAKVDELMALCDRLEAQQQQREEKHANLARASLARFAAAPTPANLNLIFHKSFDIVPADLRKSILTLAVQGKLVPQVAEDEPAKDWFRKVAKSKPFNEPVFGEPPFSLPKSWIWLRVESVFEVAGGIQKTPQRTPRDNAFPYLGVGNVYRGRLDLTNVKEFELEHGEIVRRRLESGDLLIIEGNGSFNEIGRCAKWRGEIKNCVTQNHVIRCRPCDERISDYVLLFLNSPNGMDIMQRLAITSSGLYSLSVGKIRQIEIPLPPLAEQRRIVAKVDQLMALVDQLETQLAASRATAKNLLEALVAELITR